MLFLMLVGYGCPAQGEKTLALALDVEEYPLRDALAELGIAPLNKTVVMADKAALLRKLVLINRFRWLGSPLLLAYSLAMAIVFAAVTVFAIVSGQEWGLNMFALAAMCLWFFISWTMSCLVKKYVPFPPLSSRYIEWVRTPLDVRPYHYTPIPEVVADQAKRVAQKLPSASLAVDWLETDPYLVVQLGDEEEYLYQWE